MPATLELLAVIEASTLTDEAKAVAVMLALDNLTIGRARVGGRRRRLRDALRL